MHQCLGTLELLPHVFEVSSDVPATAQSQEPSQQRPKTAMTKTDQRPENLFPLPLHRAGSLAGLQSSFYQIQNILQAGLVDMHQCLSTLELLSHIFEVVMCRLGPIGPVIT